MSCRFRGRTDRPEDAAENVSNPEDDGADACDDVEDGGGGGDDEGEAGLAGGESRVCCEAAPVQSGPQHSRGCPLLLLLRPTDIDSRGHCSLTSLFHNRFHKSQQFLLVSDFQGLSWAPGKVEQVEIWESYQLLLHS